MPSVIPQASFLLQLKLIAGWPTRDHRQPHLNRVSTSCKQHCGVWASTPNISPTLRRRGSAIFSLSSFRSSCPNRSSSLACPTSKRPSPPPGAQATQPNVFDHPLTNLRSPLIKLSSTPETHFSRRYDRQLYPHHDYLAADKLLSCREPTRYSDRPVFLH